MPDFTLLELKDTLNILDVLARMGELAEDAGFPVTLYLQPGMAPVLRLADAKLPAGRLGVDDPVSSAVPATLIDPQAIARSAADWAAASIEYPAAPKASLTQGGADGLPGHLLPAGQAAGAPRRNTFDAPAWTEAEIGRVVEVVAQARATKTRLQKEVVQDLSAELGRSSRAIENVIAKKGYRLISARVAELEALASMNTMLGGEPGELQLHSLAENAPVQGAAGACDGVAAAAPEAQQEQDAGAAGSSPSPEQAGETEAIGQGLPVAEGVSNAPAPAAQVSASRPWTEEEDAEIVEACAFARLGNQHGAVKTALSDLAVKMQRTFRSVKMRMHRSLTDRIEARLAELHLQKPNPEAPEPAAALPEQDEQQAQAVAEPDAPEQAVVEAEPEKVPPAPVVTPLPRLPQDTLTDHLTRPMTRRNRRLADDLELVGMLIAKLPTGLIASELQMQPHEVTACYDRLTGLNPQTKARRYGLAEIEARLRLLIAHDQAAA